MTLRPFRSRGHESSRAACLCSAGGKGGRGHSAAGDTQARLESGRGAHRGPLPASSPLTHDGERRRDRLRPCVCRSVHGREKGLEQRTPVPASLSGPRPSSVGGPPEALRQAACPEGVEGNLLGRETQGRGPRTMRVGGRRPPSAGEGLPELPDARGEALQPEAPRNLGAGTRRRQASGLPRPTGHGGLAPRTATRRCPAGRAKHDQGALLRASLRWASGGLWSPLIPHLSPDLLSLPRAEALEWIASGLEEPALTPHGE